MSGKSLKEGDFENVPQMKNQTNFYKKFHFFPKLLLTPEFKVGKLFKVNKFPLELEQVHESIENTLYLLGAAQAAGPARHMASLLKNTCAEGQPELINRFLLAGYDYVYDHSGNLLLIHPGLADPERMMNITCVEMNPEALGKASESINDLESPLYDRMLGFLVDVTRPEITPEDAVEDLIILAKQEVPWNDMLEVLSSLLICQPTPEMRAAMKELCDRVPRWLSLSTSRVQ